MKFIFRVCLYLLTAYSLQLTAGAASAPITVTADPDTGALYRPAGALIISGNSLLTTTAAAAAYQPLDADLTAIAALTTTATGRALLTYSASSGDMVYYNGSAWTQIASTSMARSLLASSAGIGAFNTLTGYTAAGATGTTSTNLVFSASPTLTGSPVVGGVTFSSNAATSLNSITAAASTDLTLAGGSSGASMAIGSASTGVTTTMPGAGSWTVNWTTNAAVLMHIQNLSTSSAAYARMAVNVDVSAISLYSFVNAYSSGNARYVAGGGTLECDGPGGLSISASHASGVINFFTAGNTVRGVMSAAGLFTWNGHTVFEGVTSTGATGTGNLVYSAAPTFTGTATFAAMAFSSSATNVADFTALTKAGTSTTSASALFTSIGVSGAVYVGGVLNVTGVTTLTNLNAMIGDGTADGGPILNALSTSGNGVRIRFQRGGSTKGVIGTHAGYFSGTSSNLLVAAETGLALELFANGTDGTGLTIASTGAATFSSSITMSAGTLTLTGYGSGNGAVSVGASDSGGSGFKLLRVPN